MSIEIIHDEVKGRIELFDKVATSIFLTREAIDDIADAIKDQASAEAPMGKTGELKARPVSIHHIGVGIPGTPGLLSGEVVTEFPSFGGGFTVRGAGGRFVKGGITAYRPGSRGRTGRPGGTFEKVVITLPLVPRHAVWVHNGTGIYGPKKSPIVPHAPNKYLKFEAYGKKWLLPKVKGQKPNPYLNRAFVIINRTFVPARIEKLRLEIKSLP